MGQLSFRVSNRQESLLREEAADQKISLSAYIRDSLTGEINPQDELNRELIEQKISELRESIMDMHSAIKDLMKSIIYISEFQRQFFFQFMVAMGEEERGNIALNEADKAVAEMLGKEEKVL